MKKNKLKFEFDILQEVKDACVKKFGVDIKIDLNYHLHPLTSEGNVSLKIDKFKLFNGHSKKYKEIFIQADYGLYELINYIKEYNDED